MDSVQTFAMSSVFQDEKKIRLEIRDVIRQITASVVSSEFRGLLRADFDRFRLSIVFRIKRNRTSIKSQFKTMLMRTSTEY